MSEKHQLRRHINEVLRNGADFDAFCQDFFPDVRQRYSTDMDKVVKINLLLELHDSEQILKALEQYSGGHGLPLHNSPIIKCTLAGAGLISALLLAILFLHRNWLSSFVQERRDARKRPPEIANPDSPSRPLEVISLPVESDPAGATVRNADNALLCVKTPCNLRVQAHVPLELRFTYPGRESIFKIRDPALELQNGGVRVYIFPDKVP